MIGFYSWWHFYFYGVGSPWAKCCTLPTLDFRGHRWCTHSSSGTTISTSYHWYFRCKCRSTYQWFLESHVFIFTSESSCYLRRWFLHSCCSFFYKKNLRRHFVQCHVPNKMRTLVFLLLQLFFICFGYVISLASEVFYLVWTFFFPETWRISP